MQDTVDVAGTRDDSDDERAHDAFALLRDCVRVLPPVACPTDELTTVCEAARAGFAAGDDEWVEIGDAAGWEEEPPPDDEALWVSAAMAYTSVLDDMDLNDWLAVVIEIARVGVGARIDARRMVALASRCLQVDTATVDRRMAAECEEAFGDILRMWRPLGAVDDAGALTRLGAWGLPRALAYELGGTLG